MSPNQSDDCARRMANAIKHCVFVRYYFFIKWFSRKFAYV